MIAQSQAESTRDTYNYGQYINQFPPNTIKAIRQYEQIQKKICRQKMSIMFNEICIKEMPPKYTYTHTHITQRKYCRGVRPPLMSVLDMTLNNLMVRFQ